MDIAGDHRKIDLANINCVLFYTMKDYMVS